MAQRISGPGVLLPAPQALYPSTLSLSPYTAPTNQTTLKPGSNAYIPAGSWVVYLQSASANTACAIQYKDPVKLEWENLYAPAASLTAVIPWSDGFNWRVANISDSAYGALITNAGSGYAQATTTCTPGTGNSTWQPIIGGAISAVSLVAGGAGAGYTKAPTLFMPSPPAPGIPATATVSLTAGGSLAGGQIVTAGAGYLGTTAPAVVVVPDPDDPALAAGLITNATMTATLTGGGSLTGLLLVNFGAPLTTAPTLTISGAGVSATATTNPATVVAAANVNVTLQPLP